MPGRGRPLDTVKVTALVEEIRNGGDIKKAYLKYTPVQIKTAKYLLSPLVEIATEKVAEETK